jgi:hypothetical protein
MLEEMDEKEIRYDVHWSIDLQAPEDLAHIEQIILQRNALYLLEEAEKDLRNSVDVQEGPHKLIGLVTHLMHNERKDNTVQSIVLEDETLGPVTIFLDAKDLSMLERHISIISASLLVAISCSRVKRRRYF